MNKVKISELVEDKSLEKPLDGNHGALHPTASEYVDDGIPFLLASNLRNGKIDFENCKYITKERASKLQKGFAKNGDILLTHKGTVGEVAKLNNSNFPFVMLTPQVTYYRVIESNKLDVEYLFHFFRSSYFQYQLEKLSGGGTRAYIGITKQLELEVALPSIDEQRKIGQFLSSWDEAIEAVEELIEKKKDQKKVLAEELFSGSKRLIKGSSKTKKTKYGDIPTDWDFLPISKVAKINRKSLGKEKKYKSYKYVDLSSVNEGLISIPEEEIIYEELPSRAKRIIQKGDVIFSTVRPNLLGYSVVDFDTSNHLCSTGFAVITPSVDSDTNFIYQQLYSSLFQRQVFSKVTGSNYPAINSSDFSNIRLNWPSDKNERKEIGDLLSGIELEVQLLYKKRKLLEKQKKGLMQRLLTGKVRVN